MKLSLLLPDSTRFGTVSGSAAEAGKEVALREFLLLPGWPSLPDAELHVIAGDTFSTRIAGTAVVPVTRPVPVALALPAARRSQIHDLDPALSGVAVVPRAFWELAGDPTLAPTTLTAAGGGEMSRPRFLGDPLSGGAVDEVGLLRPPARLLIGGARPFRLRLPHALGGSSSIGRALRDGAGLSDTLGMRSAVGTASYCVATEAVLPCRGALLEPVRPGIPVSTALLCSGSPGSVGRGAGTAKEAACRDVVGATTIPTGALPGCRRFPLCVRLSGYLSGDLCREFHVDDRVGGLFTSVGSRLIALFVGSRIRLGGTVLITPLGGCGVVLGALTGGAFAAAWLPRFAMRAGDTAGGIIARSVGAARCRF